MDEYAPPPMSNGKSWADYDWWRGRSGLGPVRDTPVVPKSFQEACDLTWDRCWAYIDEKGLGPDECSHVWPIAYAALNACSLAWPDVTPEAVAREVDRMINRAAAHGSRS